ncbi:MAG: NADH-quinone oxidoreductase subunit B, partial [Bacteroidota bacterium]|nr:NADH-quinone oxidoreductase subunit B [Bacteroidota bacterium]
MPRPVQYNITDKPIETPIGVVEGPEGFTGEGFFASKLSDVVGLARKNSIWPLPFATSCCGIEFMALMGS